MSAASPAPLCFQDCRKGRLRPHGLCRQLVGNPSPTEATGAHYCTNREFAVLHSCIISSSFRRSSSVNSSLSMMACVKTRVNAQASTHMRTRAYAVACRCKTPTTAQSAVKEPAVDTTSHRLDQPPCPGSRLSSASTVTRAQSAKGYSYLYG